ncbi:glycosyltransferase family 2 protein [Halobaculum magnesiiphilum]|uniref:Glycosyltransferase family 2 protein n=1 Tax=Halobaculum magnesiiphilum TaxID=1017351 RepID=A0A8T8WFC1_9EURY|nr:glycosyltransferase family 2 protein [Halobaculum magnesiiphilum]
MSEQSLEQQGGVAGAATDAVAEPDRTDERTAEELIVGEDSEVRPTLSVVMPTLNEEDGIGECIERIRTAVEELQEPTEILISDSSTDRTPEIAEEMGAIVVVPDEAGYGYAYQYAFARCRGDYIAIGDADTTYDFEELPKLYDLVETGEADMAMGSRLDGEIMPGAMPSLHQYVGNPLLTRFLNAFYKAGVSDAHSGMRVFSREAWDRMDCETDGMEFASEMIMEAGARDLEIAEEPITYHEREGEATLESFRDGWRHVRFMLENAPGYLFSAPGLLLTVAGAALMALAVSGLEPGGGSFGVRTLMAGSLFVITGVQVASFGIYATLASDPIRRPKDAITEFVTGRFTLETGVFAGLVVFTVGAGLAAGMVLQWIATGYEAIPSVGASLLAFTAIVVGVQAVFGSFFIGIIQNA